MGDVRQYFVPLMLALALHAVAMMGLYTGWNPDTVESRLIKPQMVRATLIVIEPQKVRRPAAKPVVQKKAPEPVIEKPKPLPIPEIVETKPDPEVLRRERERAAREERLRRLADTFDDVLGDEADDLTSTNEADEEAAIAQSYRFGIYELIVANWSRPPSARNDMQAKLLVELVPTGDVVSVTILEPSGNGAFDRSAEAAVRKARRFEVPVESKLFERYFRRFTLLFRPEDLLR